ncbi:MAG: hypothetical protein LBU77_05340, partial [Clostridiales bacterium]|nr:hypothetical protein [Clostridiales bacterium]
AVFFASDDSGFDKLDFCEKAVFSVLAKLCADRSSFGCESIGFFVAASGSRVVFDDGSALDIAGALLITVAGRVGRSTASASDTEEKTLLVSELVPFAVLVSAALSAEDIADGVLCVVGIQGFVAGAAEPETSAVGRAAIGVAAFGVLAEWLFVKADDDAIALSSARDTLLSSEDE